MVNKDFQNIIQITYITAFSDKNLCGVGYPLLVNVQSMVTHCCVV